MSAPTTRTPVGEKLLITMLPSDAVWLRLREKFKTYDIEEDSTDEHVYDLRSYEDSPITDDYVLFWGRDGWENGTWHAKLTLERKDGGLLFFAERGSDAECMPLMAVRRRLLSFMSDCMHAHSHNPQDGDETE